MRNCEHLKQTKGNHGKQWRGLFVFFGNQKVISLLMFFASHSSLLLPSNQGKQTEEICFKFWMKMMDGHDDLGSHQRTLFPNNRSEGPDINFPRK